VEEAEAEVEEEEEVEEEAEVEVEEVPPEDHHMPMEDWREIPLSNSWAIEKEAKRSCWPFKSIVE